MFCPDSGDEKSGMEYSKEPHQDEVPLGRYKSTYGYMELTAQEVIIHKKVLFQKEEERVIPYTQIAKVAYQKAKRLGRGFLSIRDRKDCNLPMATLENAAIDSTSIDFIAAMNEEVFCVYRFLKGWVDRNNIQCDCTSEEQVPLSKDIEQNSPVKALDLDAYYKKYYPNKANAIVALRIDTGMGFLEAKKCIDSVFARYAKDEDIEHDPTDSLHCPECFSDSVFCGKKGFNFSAGWLAERILPGRGFMLGALNANKLQCKCLNCGHTWEP